MPPIRTICKEKGNTRFEFENHTHTHSNTHTLSDLHGLRVVHLLNGIDGTLSSRKGDKGAAFALAVVVPQHRALLDGAVRGEHDPHVLLVVPLAQHPDEQLAFWRG